MDKRHHSWVFVINNYTESDMFAVQYLFKKVAYGIVGKEVAPTTGTPHLQGYCRLIDSMSMPALKKILTRAKLIVANGGDMANQVYSSKEAIWLEVGTPSEQGRRNDLKEIAMLIKNKEITMQELMFEYPDMYLRYSRSFEKMFAAVLPMRETLPEVHWRWGKSGTGKTRYVIEKFERSEIYIKDGTSWWDNYRQQQCILIDDFDNGIPFRTLLRILDRNHEQGQIKGGYVYINSPYIYITCEHPPDYYWQGNEYTQVFRRLTSVKEII